MAVSIPGAVYFDEFFAGADDNAKIAALNAWAQGNTATGARPAVIFDARTYSFSTSIVAHSGLTLLGNKGAAVREYDTGTIFSWQGTSGSSMFTYPGSQTGQGYPSDGSPRDINLHSIQFSGKSTCHFFPKYDPSTYSTNGAGHVLWMSRFHDCGWKNWLTIFWGWWDGVTVDGVTHIQGCYDTPFNLGGSENNLFGDGHSFMDAAAAYPIVASSLPFIRTQMSKSKIGRIMVTARKGGYQMSIEGGHNLVVDGLAWDAQDSDPVYGSGLKISGGDGIVITNCSFKGMMTNPAGGSGGAAANKGWIHISGGKQITFVGNNFARTGSSAPATTVPLVYVGSGVGNNQVKWGFNNYAFYNGVAAVLQQAAAGKLVTASDPLVTVTTAP